VKMFSIVSNMKMFADIPGRGYICQNSRIGGIILVVYRESS